MGYDLTVDGGMGPNTLKAINSTNQVDFYNNFKQARIDYYNDLANRIPSQKKWLNGWLNKVNEFKDKTSTNKKDVNCDE